jgi:hypothetical protein
MVFDHSGKYLYITTSDGWVRRYNLSTNQLEAGYNLGGSLNGADIAPDDSFLLVAQDNVTGGQGTFHRLDLGTGAVTNINYTRIVNEAGGWDVAIASNGLALVTTRLPDGFSGSAPLRQIDLSNNSITERADVPAISGGHQVSGGTQIHRSADRTRFFFLEPNDSGGPIFTYSATTNSFGARIQAHMYFSTASGAVNRNGTLLGTLVGIQAPIPLSIPKVALDSAPDLQFVRGLGDLDSGVAFDAVADTLYGLSSSTNEIIAYNTNTFVDTFRLAVGEATTKMVTPFGTGTLVASADGRFLALETASGIRLFSVAQGKPSAPPVATLTTRRDLMFDHAGRYLYLTTSTGLIERLELATNDLQVVANLGGKLNGADIAGDDSFLLVAIDGIGLMQGMWQKVDLFTGAVTNIRYKRGSSEFGAWDVAIASNGLALATTTAPDGFTSTMPIRQIDLATNLVTVRNDAPASTFLGVTNPTHIHRSADGTRLYFLESNNSSGPVFTYSAVSNTFGPNAKTNTFLDNSSAAVNRNGSLLVTRRGYPNHASLDTAPDFNFVEPFSFDGGVAFDAISDRLYAADRASDEIIAYDTNTLAELYRLPVGEHLTYPVVPGGVGPYTPELGTYKLVASNDGRYLALETPSGVRLFALPSQIPPPRAPTPIFGAPVSMVFDHSGTYLYIGTATGFVWPYNLSTHQLETPYALRGAHSGIDIAPNDSFLLLGQEATGLTQGRFEKISLQDGLITKINYKGMGGEIGWDVAIASNGLAFVTTNGATFVSLRQINLATNSITVRSDTPGPTGGTKIRRSADGAVLCFLDEGLSRVFTYNASSDAFGPSSYIDVAFNSSLAVNRNGSLMALRSNGTKLETLPALTSIHSFSDLNHAIVFDSVKDVLYGISLVSFSTHEIVGYDTTTFEEKARFDLGETLQVSPPPQEFHSGAFAASPDGRHLAFITATAVRVLDLVTGITTPISALPRLGNISTRAFVGGGDNTPIAGFIVSGTTPKKVVLRAIGPSLISVGLSGAVPDTTLELHDQSGGIIAFNDNWRDSQEAELRETGIAPAHDLEAAMVQTLSPGSYTVVMRGNEGSTGLGVVEVYDIEPNAASKLGNISTRGFVGLGDDALIAGVIVRSSGYDVLFPTRQLLIRGLGPSLATFNISQPLPDPVLEVRNSDGVIVQANDDWKIPQEAAIQQTGLAPADSRESALILSLAPGNYTAILRGKNNTTGTGLVEVYNLQ